MKTKRFFPYLFAACCIMTMVSLTSCHPQGEDEDENEGGKNSKDKIEYIEFKEPCLTMNASRDDIKAWMIKNMPEYDIITDSEGGVGYGRKENVTDMVAYSFVSGRCVAATCHGSYNYDKVVEFLCGKYGEKETVSITTSQGIPLELYEYHPACGDIDWITLSYLHGYVPAAGTTYNDVTVGYYLK